jgi:TPR repeat protein
MRAKVGEGIAVDLHYELGRIWVVVSLAAVTGFAVPAAAGSLEDAAAAHKRGDYETELRLLMPLADKGNAQAQTRIGSLYFAGQAVPQDYSEALRWYLKAANEGYAASQYKLSLMYGDGKGVPQNLAESVKWLRKAAAGGNAIAQDGLGILYATGDSGVDQDFSQAAKWYRKAADRGNPHAQNSLGAMYARGEGVPQDYVSAYVWYGLAAAHFSESEPERRKWAIFGRDLVASKMTLVEIAEAKRLANKWRPIRR